MKMHQAATINAVCKTHTRYTSLRLIIYRSLVYNYTTYERIDACDVGKQNLCTLHMLVWVCKFYAEDHYLM